MLGILRRGASFIGTGLGKGTAGTGRRVLGGAARPGMYAGEAAERYIGGAARGSALYTGAGYGSIGGGYGRGQYLAYEAVTQQARQQRRWLRWQGEAPTRAYGAAAPVGLHAPSRFATQAPYTRVTSPVGSALEQIPFVAYAAGQAARRAPGAAASAVGRGVHVGASYVAGRGARAALTGAQYATAGTFHGMYLATQAPGAIARGVRGGVASTAASIKSVNAFTKKGLMGLSRGMLGGVARGLLLYEAGEGIQDLGKAYSDAYGGLGGFAARAATGLVGFGFKAAGLRAGVGGAIRGASMGTSQWAGKRGLKGLVALGTSKLPAGFQKYAYDVPRNIVGGVLGFGAKGMGKGMPLIGKLALAPVTVPVSMARGMIYDVPKAYLGGVADIGREAIHGWRVLRGTAKTPMARRGPGIIGRLYEGVDPTRRRFPVSLREPHPLWGVAGWGAAFGGAPIIAQGAQRGAPERVVDGINPKNYGGGVMYMGPRGRRRDLFRGSESVSQRMVTMRR